MGDSAASGAPLSRLTVSPPYLRQPVARSSGCLLPALTHLEEQPNPQISPRCFLKLFFSLPLLLPPRISISARNGSPTSPTEATTTSTLGNQSSLTSLRQNQCKPVLKEQR